MYGDALANDNMRLFTSCRGSMGWDVALAGRLTVLWNPLIQASGPGFGVWTSPFGVKVTGTPNIPIVVGLHRVGFTNPVWTLLRTYILTNGSVYFSDPEWTNYLTRFYRICSP